MDLTAQKFVKKCPDEKFATTSVIRVAWRTITTQRELARHTANQETMSLVTTIAVKRGK